MSRRSRWIAGLTILAACVAIKVLYESRREWNEGWTAVRAGRTEDAILHLERAIHWYLPGNPFTGKAVRALWEIGQGAEASDPARALLAYDALRGSLHSIRSFYWPYREWIEKSNERIAQLRASEESKRDPSRPFEKALEFHRQVLIPTDRPRIGWVLWAQLGFWGWIGSVVGWIFRGFDREGRMQMRRSLPWITALVLFFTVWVIGLSRA
ncbi:MAG: hypothetical protein V1495_02250 [Pseudomonadota bacterium]